MACEFDAPEGVTSHVLANDQLPTLPPGQYTILAAFVLACPRRRVLKTIALATGAKCLPVARIPPAGDALHDSHAEILARRAAVRWFYEEIGRDVAGERSAWLQRGEGEGDGGRYELEEGVSLHLYVSTPPCGDASTRFLASSQDPATALFKDGSPLSLTSLNTPLIPETGPALALARGRDGYLLYGVLRTKPGRADSPRTECMSCADKIALWAVCGLQGALLSIVLKPVWIESVTIGEVGDADKEVVREDCERAFGGRVRGVRDLPTDYALHEPAIHFTALPFASSRTSVLAAHPGCTPKSSNESLAWHADSASPPDVLINGRKRGVAQKHAHNVRFWPQHAKIALFNLHLRTLSALGPQADPPPRSRAASTYHAHKHPAPDSGSNFSSNFNSGTAAYQHAKAALLGPGNGRPFAGWLRGGGRGEGFDCAGRVLGAGMESNAGDSIEKGEGISG